MLLKLDANQNLNIAPASIGRLFLVELGNVTMVSPTSKRNPILPDE